MASKSSDKANKKVFDVAKPGKTAASASGRPLIIGHKTMIKDPMVKDIEVDGLESDKPSTAPVVEKLEEDKASGEPDESKKLNEASTPSPSSTKINIKPPEADAVSDEAKPKTEEATKQDDNAQDNKPEDQEKVEVSTPTKEDKPEADDSDSAKNESDEKSEEKSDEDTGSDEAALDAVAVQALEKKNKKLDEEDKAKQEKLQKLIQEKKYFAPIGVKTRNRNIRSVLIVILIMVIVAIVVVYYLVDANIIDIGVKVPYNIVN